MEICGRIVYWIDDVPYRDNMQTVMVFDTELYEHFTVGMNMTQYMRVKKDTRMLTQHENSEKLLWEMARDEYINNRPRMMQWERPESILNMDGSLTFNK